MVLLQILQFSLQILQNPIVLTGFGLFDINYDLLHSVIKCVCGVGRGYNWSNLQFIGAITTYMVIIIGFMPSINIFKEIPDG